MPTDLPTINPRTTGVPASPTHRWTTNRPCLHERPDPRTPPNAAVPRNDQTVERRRVAQGEECNASPYGTAVMSVRSTVGSAVSPAQSRPWNSGGQTGAALEATRLQDGTTCGGCHAGAETVLLRSAAGVGLESALHSQWSDTCKCCGLRVFDSKRIFDRRGNSGPQKRTRACYSLSRSARSSTTVGHSARRSTFSLRP